MKRITIAFLAALAVLAVTVSSKEFEVTIQKGGAEVIKSGTGEQKLISKNGTMASQDMLTLAEGQEVTISLETNSTLLLKGPASITINHSGNTVLVTLEDGQVLLDRSTPYEYTSMSIVAKGFSFVPMGTCAAVKTSKNAPPTAAVVEGNVRMQAPSGEAVVVKKGNYGSMGSDGKLATGELSPRAVASLNQWRATGPSGRPQPRNTKAATPATPATKTTSATPATPATPAPKAQKKQPAAVAVTPAPAPTPAPIPTPAPAPAPAASAPAQQTEDAASEPSEENTQADVVQKVDKTPPPPSSAKWQISAGSATVDNEQWTRIALGVDVPIWKFGVFFDVEFFVDNEGHFSDKGWNFSDEPLEALARKIRYIRFGQEGEPLFIKFGGLSSVSMGYGFLVDRFTNMLHYPDEKLLGLQLDINDISPIGISLQTLIADFNDFNNDGGLAAARLGFKPLKTTGIPIVKGITISGSYARDLNQYAPARTWDYTMNGAFNDRDQDNITDSSFYYDHFGSSDYYNELRNDARELGDFDTIIEHQDTHVKSKDDPFGLIGADIGIPLITTNLVSLDLYGQAGLRDDGKHGWGIGAPGVSLKVWRFWSSVEYRRVQGRFQPGYFGTYYLDERLLRDPKITTKEDRLLSDTLNGVYGRLGFNISDIFLLEGRYQYMVGKDKDNKDQRFEACGALGDLVLQKIPKLNRAEIYYYKSRIGNNDEPFFEETPFMYYGYRTGFAIADGASLIWDARYGYKIDDNGKLVPSNNISVQTALTF